MNAGFRARAEALFVAALEHDPSTRDAWLAEQAAGDRELADEVRSLLFHASVDAEFLATPAILHADAAPEDVEGRTPAPALTRLGRYVIERVLGEGGMGVVYAARQETPSRTVALKLLPPWSASPSARLRFEREAQLLGRLSHPGIAQIFEAGVADTPAGAQPYFAMELVAGSSLVEHARGSLDERLALLADVCDAVQHAHERGVVHRDLKPSNILVVVEGGVARVKVLDFGIACTLDAGEREAPATRAGEILGTLAYMSPEQARGESAAIDGRSDVYALGVIAYELVAGRLPYDVAGLPLARALDAIASVEPPPLRRVAPRTPADAATIVAKAMEKDPARRYPSVAELGRDLRRFLAHEPIVARPHTRAYVARRFVRRHRVLAAATASVVLVLVLGIAGTSWQAVRASDERDRAEGALARESRSNAAAQAAAARATSVLEYFVETLAKARPARPGATGPDVRMIDVIDRARATLPGSLTGQPGAEADVLLALAKVYTSLDARVEARVCLERCIALRESTLGPADPVTLEAVAELGALAAAEDRTLEARALLTRALDGLTRAHGEDDSRRIDCLEQLALCLQRAGEWSEAERRMREALRLREQSGDVDNAAWSKTAGNLAFLLLDASRLPEAQELLVRALAVGERVDGEFHPDTLQKLSNLGVVLRMRSEPAEAQPYLERALAASRQLLGDRHRQTLTVMNNLAGVLEEQLRSADAHELYQQVFDLCSETLGPEHGDTLVALSNLAHVAMQLDRLDEAEELMRRCAAAMAATLGSRDARTLGARYNLANLLYKRGAFDEALEISLDVMNVGRKALPPDHASLALFVSNAGACEMALAHYEAAEPLLLEGYEILERTLGTAHVRTRQAMQVLAGLYDAWGKPERANEYREMLKPVAGE